MPSRTCSPPLASSLTYEQLIFPSAVTRSRSPDMVSESSPGGLNGICGSSRMISNPEIVIERPSILENFPTLQFWNPSRLPVEWRMDGCLVCASSAIWPPFEELQGSPPVGRNE